MDLEEQMKRDLLRFHELRAHRDPAFAEQLVQMQSWQTDRLKQTHKELLADETLKDATEFFIGDMYGGVDLTQMAKEVERALSLAMSLLPEKVMYTSAVALEANALTLELDEQMTEHYLQNYAGQPMTHEIWHQCYLAVGQRENRVKQMELLRELGMGLDNYVRSRLIQGAFKLARKPATKAGFVTLYDFLERGFSAMKQIESTETFVDSIVQPELDILDKLFAGQNPFV